jgi:hypothetical protein
MFRTSYVHLQEDYIVHAALYGMFSMLKLQYFSIKTCIMLENTTQTNSKLQAYSRFTYGKTAPSIQNPKIGTTFGEGKYHLFLPGMEPRLLS